ncbi:hypothetical protein AB1K70_24645 [Bremerella sp. JC770]|uniref:hypothetical protein n=1 Tax=Bremerella sp. JC770 TaxID=3232137 RepID=UPI003458815D
MKSKTARLLSFILGVLIASDSFAQSQNDLPIPTFLDLHQRGVTRELCEDTFLIVGTIQQVEYTGERSDAVVNAFTRIEVHLQLEVDRVLSGPTPQQKQITVRSVWFMPVQFLLDGEPSQAQQGDRIFYMVKLKTADSGDSVWEGGRIGLASEREVNRLTRVSEALVLGSSSSVAKQIIQGCSDTDGIFAAWCMRLLTEVDQLKTAPDGGIFKSLKENVAHGTVVEECRLVLQNCESPNIAYENADRILAAKERTEHGEQFRHACHLRRLSWIMEISPAGTDSFEWEKEVRYLLVNAYPTMSTERRLEAIEKLREFSGADGPEHLRGIALACTSKLLDPRSKQLRSAIFRFYNENFPPTEKLWFGYCNGLHGAMMTDSTSSVQLCQEGIDLFSLMILGANEDLSHRACEELSRYGESCRQQKIGWPNLAYRIQDLRNSTPHPDSRRYLSKTLERWGIGKETVDSS